MNRMDAIKVLEKHGLNYNDDTFKYQMLDRLRMDCNYYLGYGYRNSKVLWAGDVKEQILIMKSLYHSFPKNKKPQWITLEDISELEKQMMA